MADHHLLMPEPNSSEEPWLEGSVLLEVVQTYLYQPLFYKPLRRNSEPKESLSRCGIALQRGL
jgi:hypothetical protein